MPRFGAVVRSGMAGKRAQAGSEAEFTPSAVARTIRHPIAGSEASRSSREDGERSGRPRRDAMTEPPLRLAAIGLDHRHIRPRVGRLPALGADCPGFRMERRPLRGLPEGSPRTPRVDAPCRLLFPVADSCLMGKSTRISARRNGAGGWWHCRRMDQAGASPGRDAIRYLADPNEDDGEISLQVLFGRAGVLCSNAEENEMERFAKRSAPRPAGRGNPA